MNEECSDIRTEAYAAGDKHYKAMTEFAIAPTPQRRRLALAFAVRYRRALDWVIDCYRRVTRRRDASPQLERAIEYKNLVEHDIDILKTSPPITEAES